MKQRRKTSETVEPERLSLDAGDFRLDGSWNWAANANQRGPLYAFIRGLCRARKAAELSPAQIAEQIDASRWASAFGELVQWRTLPNFSDWPLAWARTSADDAVKRGGVGPVNRFHWQRGAFVAGEDERPFVAPSVEEAKRMVRDLGKQLGWKDLELPQVSEHAPTQGHDPRCNCEECFASAWETTTRAVGA